jgi:ribosomal protein S18 acetylase RimI-like enzyme
MTLVKYHISNECPTAEEFIELRRLIGWADTDLHMAKRSLANSLFHVVVKGQGKLIGMGRVVGDGVMYFYIQDVVVAPDYQNQGIGQLLMDRIEAYLSATAVKGSTIGLLAAKGKEGFYSRYGYKLRPNEGLGHGMCKFI